MKNKKLFGYDKMHSKFAPMPIVKNSGYSAPFYYKNGHVSTIAPNLFKKAIDPGYVRERLELNDGDFLDIDWLKVDEKKPTVVVSHGLEGNSHRHYVLSAAKYFQQAGWNVLAWNYRSCSGEMNRLLRLYHHGVTDDLNAIVNHALAVSKSDIYLLGYSMGGSTILKFLGEKGSTIDDRVKKTAVFSVPCNLWNSAEMLLKKSNLAYKKRFLKKLKKKIIAKAEQFPNQLDISGINNLTTFDEFDNRFTAPLHGFKNAMDFYQLSTADKVMGDIQVPSLIVNALNDPLLGEKCYPYELARNHQYVYLETPKTGGHVGFPLVGNHFSWSEIRAKEFFESQ